MQALPRRVDAVQRSDGMMSVRIDLGEDIETATRLVRKLSAYVTVAKAEVLMEPQTSSSLSRLAQA